MDHDEHALHEPSLTVYWVIYILLMIGLVLTVVVAYVPLGMWNTPAALTIAFAKAFLVVLYFMHVRYGLRLTWLVAAGGFIWLAILVVFTVSDYETRLWLEGPTANPPLQSRTQH